MSRSSLRRARRKKTAELIAAGLHTRRSHYQSADISAAVQADLAAMRAQIAAQRDRMRDPNWAFRSQAGNPPKIVRKPGIVISEPAGASKAP